MGIKNLNNILKSKQEFKKVNISSLRGSVVGVDFSLFLYRFKYNQNNPLECFLRQVNLFLKYNILPVYVLDGRAPLEKKFILDKRAHKRDKILEELNVLKDLKKNIGINPELENEINHLEKKCVFFEKDIIEEILNFFNLCGIPIIQENAESDWILANLNKHHLIDYILSEDSDLLTFGGKKILRNFSIKNESANLYVLDDILFNLNISQEELVDLSILCGCDYCNKIKGINCSQSYDLIKKYKNIEKILIKTNNEIIDYQNARDIFLKEFSKNQINTYKTIITKKPFQFNSLDSFLRENIDKSYLIPYFLKNARKFFHSKYLIYK